jgi:hypothetical protein
VPGLGHLQRERGGLKFGGVSEGLFAQRLLDAAVFADERLTPITQVFKARILEIPSLRICALWLFSRRGISQFVPLTDEPSAGFTALHVVDSIKTKIDQALAHAAVRVRHAPPRSARTEPN